MSLQTLIAKMIFKLPAGMQVKMAGGKPLEVDGRVLEPQLQMVAWNGRNNPPLSSLPAEAVQAATVEQLAMLAAKPEAGVKIENFTIPGPDKNDISVRSYVPQDQNPKAPMMIYYHMGGGVVGDLDTCNAFCSIIASVAKCPVVSVEYRLAPQHKFPAGLDDCLTAYEWGLRNAGKYGAPEGQASVGGDSMGGNFSAIVSQEMQRQGKPCPDLQLLIYPAIDISEDTASKTKFGETFSLSTDTMNWFMQQYLPAGFDVSDLLLSPGQATSLEGLPPAIVITAGHDPLSDEGDAYAERLKREGVDVMHKRYDALAHAFTAFTGFSPASRAACEEIARMVATMNAKA